MATFLSSRNKGRSFCYSNSRSKGTPVGKDKFSVNMRNKTIKLRVGVSQKRAESQVSGCSLNSVGCSYRKELPKAYEKGKKTGLELPLGRLTWEVSSLEKRWSKVPQWQAIHCLDGKIEGLN